MSRLPSLRSQESRPDVFRSSLGSGSSSELYGGRRLECFGITLLKVGVGMTATGVDAEARSFTVPVMRYELVITEEALAQLRSLPQELRQRVGRKLDDLQTDLNGDVKKLAGQGGKYRLRVGSHRVLFTLEKT